MHSATLRAIASLVLLGVYPALAAEAYPVRPIRHIVGFAPGGSTDLVARIMAGKLTEALGQQVIVDNRPGAGGSIAASMVAKAAPDGYTTYHAGITMAINPALRKDLPYHPLRDFTPISLVAKLPTVLMVNASAPPKTVKEFVAHARANPGKLNYASSGAGAAPHLAMELFKKMAGIQLTHVPYKGSAPALNDLMAGNVYCMFDNLPAALSQIKAGRVRALAVGTLQRSNQIPDVPTIAESGYPDFEVTVWYGMFAPAGLPKPVLTKLNSNVQAILRMPDVQKRFEELSAVPSPMTPEQFSAFLKSEVARWATVIREAGITVE
jgi:tripartite-type tricarboxylate transporter receptor subunit TctC